MRDARNATYRHSRTASRINNAGRGREDGVRAAEDEKGDEGEEAGEEVEEEDDDNEKAEEEEAREEKRGKRATRGAASGAGRGSDVYPGRPLLPCPPDAPLRGPRSVPPSPPVLAEKERALGNPALRSVASTLCVLLLLGCTHSGVATVSAHSERAGQPEI